MDHLWSTKISFRFVLLYAAPDRIVVIAALPAVLIVLVVPVFPVQLLKETSLILS
jgi:hypothetical protein